MGRTIPIYRFENIFFDFLSLKFMFFFCYVFN